MLEPVQTNEMNKDFSLEKAGNASSLRDGRIFSKHPKLKKVAKITGIVALSIFAVTVLGFGSAVGLAFTAVALLFSVGAFLLATATGHGLLAMGLVVALFVFGPGFIPIGCVA